MKTAELSDTLRQKRWDLIGDCHEIPLEIPINIDKNIRDKFELSQNKQLLPRIA